MAFLYICVCLGSFVGGILLLFGIFGGMSAPQQGAAAATAVGCAVVPYVFMRAIDLASQADWRRAVLKELGALRAAPSTLTAAPVLQAGYLPQPSPVAMPAPSVPDLQAQLHHAGVRFVSRGGGQGWKIETPGGRMLTALNQEELDKAVLELASVLQLTGRV